MHLESLIKHQKYVVHYLHQIPARLVGTQYTRLIFLFSRVTTILRLVSKFQSFKARKQSHIFLTYTPTNPPTRCASHIPLAVRPFVASQLRMSWSTFVLRLMDEEAFGGRPIGSRVRIRNTNYLHLPIDRTTESPSRYGEIHIGIGVSQLHRSITLPRVTRANDQPVITGVTKSCSG